MNKTLLAMALATCALNALAAANGEVSAKISTLGFGVEYAFPVNPQFDLGVNANYFKLSKTFDDDDLTLDGDVQLFTFGALGYYYPMIDNGFHVNGGLYYNGNKVTLDAKPKGNNTYTINNTVYKASDIADAQGDLTFNKVAPYLGIGWKSGDRSREGFSFDANLGVMFHGTPKFTFDAKCKGELAKNQALCNELQRNVTAERNKQQDDIDKYKFYPVASIGFIYRF